MLVGRGANPVSLVGPAPSLLGGMAPGSIPSSATPSSAIRDIYSLSILALSGSPPRPLVLLAPVALRSTVQSLARWPPPPHLLHTTACVTFFSAWHSQSLWSEAPQFLHLRSSSSLSVPFNKASSLIWVFFSSLVLSGAQIASLIIEVIFLIAPCRPSSVGADMRAWRSSSSPGMGWPSFLPLPSLTEPLPRIMILVPVSSSNFFRELPLGPISSPIKLTLGFCCTGIITFSW